MKPCPKCGYKPNPRNLDQNALQHVWYLQVAEFMNITPADAKAYCKLRIGVPILRAESEEFAKRYDALIKDRFSYEEKLEIMHWLPVTSLFTKGQASRYSSDMQHHFGEQCLTLSSINEDAA